MSNKYKLIIFDFDGVIADGMENNFPTILKKANKVAREVGAEEFESMEEFKRFAGMRLSDKLEYLDLHRNQYPRLFKKSFKLVGEVFRDATIFDEVKELVKTLKKSGYMLTIATRNRGWIVKTFLAKNRIRRHFRKIIGRGKSFDKSHNLSYLMKRYKVESHETLFITDTVNDVKDGLKVGVDMVAVSYGIDSEKDLKKNGAKNIAHTPLEILNFID